MNGLLLDPSLRALLGLSVCLLLLLAGLARSWSMGRGLRMEQAALAARVADQELRLEQVQQRLERVEDVGEAQVSDARTRHGEDVVEVLDSLLRLNESLRPASGLYERTGDAS